MARKKRGSGDNGQGIDEWILTYSDTVTLLLTFFILLYTFSTVDNQKLKSISQAFQAMFTGQPGQSIIEGSGVTPDAPLESEVNPENMNGELYNVYEQVKAFIDENQLDASLQIKEDERGIILQMKDSILFESGKAELKEESTPMLSKISGLINSLNNPVIVEGHTDNVPISNYIFKSNWELSTARSVSVVRYFIEGKGLKPERFTAAAYGQYKPIAPNDNDENRAKNRRVNILLVVSEKEKKK
ncbi:OmpA family protein [Clostridium hydrogeniformans]|uniref:OmpA family protein n=1 Tax=Clostridium hydrogeniformans TaxID=349933 RepID=UPI000481D01D|nr:OmpA family protein [Clostridium hydrogeniformans]